MFNQQPRSYLPALGYLALFVFLLIWEACVPPFLGLANNADFPRVTSILSLGPERPNTNTYQQDFAFFTSDYTMDRKWHGEAPMATSQIPLVWVTREVARFVTGSLHYDIRYFAALNIALLAGAMLATLLFLRDQQSLVYQLLPALLIWAVTDAIYVVYLNSFYMDATALVGFLCTVAAACWLTRNRFGAWTAAAFIVSALLLTTSKAVHAPLGVLAAALAIWFARRAHTRLARGILLGGTVCLIAVLPVMLRVPGYYQAFPTYNLIFLKLARLSPQPASMLTELGLPASDVRVIGKNAWEPESLILSGQSQEQFVRTVSLRRQWGYFLTHPKMALAVLNADLRENAPQMLVSFYGNYRREDGFPPTTLARHFRTWSSLRTWMLEQYPYYVPILYAALPIVFWRKKLFPIALFLLLAGIGEFLFASWGDAIDTPRHLILFHLITDVIIVFLAGGCLAAIQTLLQSPEHQPDHASRAESKAFSMA